MKKQSVLLVWSVMCIMNAASNAVAARQMENLDRGVVAVSQGDSGVFISWRLFGTDPETIAFNLYRDAEKINDAPITDSTNYTDPAGTAASTYSIAPVIDKTEQKPSTPVSVWADQYLEIPLKVPAGGTPTRGRGYRYSPNDASAGDLDGDGQYEIVLKWSPSNARDNSHSGSTGNVYLDAYEMDGTFLWRIDLGINIRAGAHYNPFIVYDLDGDGKAEIACRTSDAAVDGAGTVIGDPSADYRERNGYILTGPEYLTIFEGKTGKVLKSTAFYPDRVDVRQWGDDYGNRSGRFLAAVAYFDGQRPTLIMARGYYNPQPEYTARNEIVAYNWRDGALNQVWYFKANTKGPNSDYVGQGCHSLSVADVDGDGKDEIIYGACVINDDGTGLYTTKLGHGDALHVSDMDPARPGLEVWQCHEDPPFGATFRDAATGEILYRYTARGDTGRACAGDITAEYPGYETWASGVPMSTCTGENLGRHSNPTNFMVWWDGDLLREFLNSNRISKYDAGTLLTAQGCSSNNGSKSTPCLSADLFGDWREEVIWRTRDNQALRIYTTTDVTGHRIPTLMHDSQYRVAIAWQNAGYNQPPHPSFYLGHGMKTRTSESQHEE